MKAFRSHHTAHDGVRHLVLNAADTSGAPCPCRRQNGFTLIEIIAVVAIFGLVFSLGIPQLNSSKKRLLKNEAETLAASLEYARQRAVMSGIPHRVLLDLEEGSYRTEWWVSEEKANAALQDSGATNLALDLTLAAPTDDSGYSSGSPLDRHPPRREGRDYYPVPNRQLGAFTWLNDAVFFSGLDGSSGWVDSGQVQIVFDSDGTTEFARLELSDADDNFLTLEIEPILDRVRRRDGEARL